MKWADKWLEEFHFVGMEGKVALILFEKNVTYNVGKNVTKGCEGIVMEKVLWLGIRCQWGICMITRFTSRRVLPRLLIDL